jgi:Fe-S cluster assembly ATPase SufC
MHYDSDFPFVGLKKTTAVDTELIREKQYNYLKAFINHGERIEETVDPDTVKHTKYSGVIISHGETIEEVPEYIPKKKYMWSSFVDFFKQQQKFQRHHFVPPASL